MSQVLPERRSNATAELWEPFSELDQIGERMRQVLEQSFGGLAPSLFTEAIAWSPPVDVEEADDAYIVKAELPGVKRDNVNIEIVGNELFIAGEIKEEERKGVLRRRARRTGRFEFRLRLPDQVETEQVDANLTEGVLTVRVPKSQRAQRKRIEVKGS
jgi:HSP20 family protein